MEDKSNNSNRPDNTNREAADQNAANATGNQTGNNKSDDDGGLTPGQLSNIQRSPSSRSAGAGSAAKPFITGTDSDGQL